MRNRNCQQKGKNHCGSKNLIKKYIIVSNVGKPFPLFSWTMVNMHYFLRSQKFILIFPMFRNCLAATSFNIFWKRHTFEPPHIGLLYPFTTSILETGPRHTKYGNPSLYRRIPSLVSCTTNRLNPKEYWCLFQTYYLIKI